MPRSGDVATVGELRGLGHLCFGGSASARQTTQTYADLLHYVSLFYLLNIFIGFVGYDEREMLADVEGQDAQLLNGEEEQQRK